MEAQDKKVSIVGEPTLDPMVCRFVVGQTLLDEGTVVCRNKDMAEGSALLEALFAIDGIREVMVHADTLTIAKNTTDAWQIVGKDIGGAIRSAIASGKTLVSPQTEALSASDDYIRGEIEDLFAKEINPQIASHGGRVELAEVRDGSVHLRLGGGCQGCASANVTLKHGIEQAIRRRVPEVKEIVDVTDHASGSNPYYT